MHPDYEKKKPATTPAPGQPGPLVEATDVAGGHDKATGADVIRAKRAPSGKVDESMTPTDPREG